MESSLKYGADWNRQERISVSKHAELRILNSLKSVFEPFLHGNRNFAMAA